MDVVVQWVRTSWTKRSRGGAGAAVRNRAPVAFALPEGAVAPCVHEVSMDESEDFAPRSRLLTRTPVHDGLRLMEEDGLVRVLLVPNTWGAPRERRRPPAVRLARGEWLRWQINYRFVGASTGHWHYRLDTLNLGHGAAVPGLFLGGPDHEVDERARLF